MAEAKRKQPINFIQGLELRAEASFKELYGEILEALEGISPFDKDVLAYRAVQVALEKARYSERVQQTVADASLAAANNALGPIAKVQADKYIRWRMNEVYDGVTLSQRLRRNATETAEILTNTIRTQLKTGGTWTQLADKITRHDKVGDISVTLAELAKAGKKMNVDPLEINSLAGRAQRYISKLSPNDAPTSYLKAAYQELISTVEKRAGAAAVDKALKDAIDAKVKYNAERISRTEIARAHNEAFHTRHDFDPDVTGYQWTLSSRHHITDECTMIAELDNGAGPGVYRKENCPQVPVHPNCMCMLVPYVGELPEKTTFKTFRDYLAEQPDKKRADIIGKANAVNPVLYRRGLEKRGLDPDNPGGVRRIPEELIILQKNLENGGKSSILSHEEATQRLKDVLGVDLVDTEGLTAEVVELIGNSLSKIHEEYPQLKGVIHEFKILDVGAKDVAKVDVLYEGLTGKVSVSLGVNPVKVGSLDVIEEQIKQNVENGFWTPKNGIEGIIRHEMAHATEVQQTFAEYSIDFNNLDTADNTLKVKAMRAYGRGKIANKVVRQALKNLGMGGADWELLCGYAKHGGIPEAFAEALSDASSGKLSGEIIKIVKGGFK